MMNKKKKEIKAKKKIIISLQKFNTCFLPSHEILSKTEITEKRNVIIKEVLIK